MVHVGRRFGISVPKLILSELDDVLEASITDLPSDAFLTKYLVSVPIILLAFAMLFGKFSDCSEITDRTTTQALSHTRFEFRSVQQNSIP